MTREEFARLVMALKTYYPKDELIPNQQAAELWFYQLQDIEYKIAEMALNKWVATNRWSPRISDIRQAAAEIVSGETADWSEGWEQVIKAVESIGMYREQQALESMDEITRRCVERLGFQQICMSNNITADRANFREIYEAEAERAKTRAQIPERLRALIEKTQVAAIEEKGST